MTHLSPSGEPTPYCLVGNSGPALFGLTTADRTRRLFARAKSGPELTLEQAAGHKGIVVMVRGDAAIDQPLIAALLSSPGLLLVGQGSIGEVPLSATVDGRYAVAAADVLLGRSIDISGAPLDRRRPQDMKADFWKALRKRETPYAFAV